MIAREEFNDVPSDSDGKPMLVATCEEDFNVYVTWLAGYLYRPIPGSEEPLPEESAGIEIIGIESDIAHAIWNDPHAHYPPPDRLPPNGARHADILHQAALSKILSRVPDQAIRIKLLRRFYKELNRDMSK